MVKRGKVHVEKNNNVTEDSADEVSGDRIWGQRMVSALGLL